MYSVRIVLSYQVRQVDCLFTVLTSHLSTRLMCMTDERQAFSTCKATWRDAEFAPQAATRP